MRNALGIPFRRVGASKYLNSHYEYANIFSGGFFYYIYFMYIKSSTQITISYIDTCTLSSTGILSITVQVGIKHHYQSVNCIYQPRIVSSSITRWNINHIKVIVIDFAQILPWHTIHANLETGADQKVIMRAWHLKGRIKN